MATPHRLSKDARRFSLGNQPCTPLTAMRGPRNIPCAMHSTDQAEELRKLETLYEQMSDGELRALDEKPEDLTDIAQQVLRAEVARRGLQA